MRLVLSLEEWTLDMLVTAVPIVSVLSAEDRIVLMPVDGSVKDEPVLLGDRLDPDKSVA